MDRAIFYSSDDILQSMLDGVECGVEANTDPECAALMLEIMAESARNPQNCRNSKNNAIRLLGNG